MNEKTTGCALKYLADLNKAACRFGVPCRSLTTDDGTNYRLIHPFLLAGENMIAEVTDQWNAFLAAVKTLQNPYIAFNPLDPLKEQAARVGLFSAVEIGYRLPNAEILLPCDITFGLGMKCDRHIKDHESKFNLHSAAWVPPTITTFDREGTFSLSLKPPQGNIHVYTVRYSLPQRDR